MLFHRSGTIKGATMTLGAMNDIMEQALAKWTAEAEERRAAMPGDVLLHTRSYTVSSSPNPQSGHDRILCLADATGAKMQHPLSLWLRLALIGQRREAATRRYDQSAKRQAVRERAKT